MTPYYKEDVLYSEEELNKENEDGISILFYLRKIYPGSCWVPDTLFAERINLSVSINHNAVFSYHCNLDEWKNFLERVDYHPKPEDSLREIMDDVRHWVSYRGQTLSRTGMQNINWITLACPKILPSFFSNNIWVSSALVSERDDVL